MQCAVCSVQCNMMDVLLGVMYCNGIVIVHYVKYFLKIKVFSLRLKYFLKIKVFP